MGNNIIKRLLVAVMAIAGIGAPAAPYPVDVMQWTQQEKDRQRQAGTELLKQIGEATAKKQEKFTVHPGVYRFKQTTLPWQPTHIVLQGVKNFTLEGNGAWFYFETYHSALVMSGCDNVTVKNLNIDYDPLPYVQGTVVSIKDTPPRSFIFKPDPGYAMPETFLAGRLPHSHNRRAFLWDRKTGLLKPDQLGMDIEENPENVKKLPDGNYEIKIWVWWGRSLAESNMREGDAITLLRRAGRAIRMENCGRIVLDNVDVYASGFVAYVGNSGEGPFTLRNCDLKPRPGTDRLLAGNADGINIRSIAGGTTIENCTIEAIGDDCINLQGIYYTVFQQLSPTELIVAPPPGSEGANPVWHFLAGTPWNDPERPDNKKLKNWEFLGSRKVVEKVATKFTVPAGQKSNQWEANTRYEPGKEYPALKIKLDAPLTIAENTVFWSENAIVRGSIIRNNVFHNNVARGIRLQTINALVENNRISYTTGCAMSLGGQPGFWGEATNCMNVTIRNNVFQESGLWGGNAAIEMTVEGNPEKAEPISSIRIENNRIIKPRGGGIELSGCSNIQLISNEITGCNSRPYFTTYNPESIPPGKKYGQPIIVGRGVKELKVVDTPKKP